MKDAGGDPLIGVNAKVKRFYGRYYHRYKRKLLRYRPGKEIFWKFLNVGYATKTVKVQNAQVLNIVLTEDTEVLNEVVCYCIGYQEGS